MVGQSIKIGGKVFGENIRFLGQLFVAFFAWGNPATELRLIDTIERWHCRQLRDCECCNPLSVLIILWIKRRRKYCV